MSERSWYNGYSPPERDKNFRELKRQLAAKELDKAKGPCALCGDPGDADIEVTFEYHNEDYSLPLCKTEPGLVVLCWHCHRIKLHKRFLDPIGWQIFLAHVRRGGYARDLKNPAIARELKTYRAAIEGGKTGELTTLRDYAGSVGKEWFANLRMDCGSKKDPAARPRP